MRYSSGLRTAWIIGFVACWGAAAAAQQGAIVLETTRALDGRGNTLADQRFVVRDGLIVEIAQAPAVEADTVYDLRGFTVLPGLIDTHVHIGWHFDADGKLHSGAVEETDGQVMLRGVENAWDTLMGGVAPLSDAG